MNTWEDISLLDPLQYAPLIERSEVARRSRGSDGEYDEADQSECFDRSMFSSTSTSRISNTRSTARGDTRGSSQPVFQEEEHSTYKNTPKSFQQAERELRVSCPSIPSSGGIYDQYGNSTAPQSVSRPNTSVLDSFHHTHKQQHATSTTGAASVSNDKFLAEFFHQGWTLSKGWRNRPRIGKIDSTAISRDIDEFAAQRQAIRNRKEQKNDFGFTQRSEPVAWKSNIIVSRNAVHKSKKAELFGENWAVDEVPGPKYSPDLAIFASQKSAPFSRANRFERGNNKSFSPGPVYFPPHPTGVLWQNQKGAVNMDTAGRGLYNSIYYDREITPAPGKLYDTREAMKRTSTAMASNGMLLPPKSASMKSRNKEEQIAININPLTKLKKLREKNSASPDKS